MNGPKPVCTSARKKMNQSRPRKLWREGAAMCSISGSDIHDKVPFQPIVGPWPSRAKLQTAFSLDALTIKLQRLQTARRAKHHYRLILLVFGRCRYLLPRQFQGDAVTLIRDAPEMQRAPLNHDLSDPDPEKSSEIDDGGANYTGPIDDHVDDAPHVLVRCAANLAAKHTVRLLGADNGDGGWRRRLFRGRR